MGSYCMSDSDSAKCGPYGSSVSSFGSCSTYSGSTYTPYPTVSTYSPYPTYSPGGSYTPYPTCPSGQWWDTATSSCHSSTATYSPYPTYSETTTSYTPPPTTYSPPPTTE